MTSRPLVLGPAFAVSVLALAAGLGLAMPRFAKEDGGPVAWLGLVVLVVGGVAALWCSWRVLRATRRRPGPEVRVRG